MAVAGRGGEAHPGAGVARRQAHHERMRDERAREAAAGDAELPPEDDAVEMASAVHVLDSVAEVGPNYTLLRSKETKAKRRKRKREDARAALDGHTVLSTGSRLEIFCDSERWYPATVMAREEDGDGRIVHEVEYDGFSDRRWWHMLDDERWRAVPEQAGAGAGGAAADGDGDAAMDRADGEQGAHRDRLWRTRRQTTQGRRRCGGAVAQGETREGAGLCGDQQDDVRRDWSSRDPRDHVEDG